jgi:hypothetical protein
MNESIDGFPLIIWCFFYEMWMYNIVKVTIHVVGWMTIRQLGYIEIT